MNLKEFFRGEQGVHDLGAFKFSRGIFNTEVRTPHYEMDKAMEAYETRGQIASAVDQMARFILGKEIQVKTDDSYTKQFYEKWFKQRARIRYEIEKFVVTLMMTGNGYIEPAYKQMTNGVPLVDNIFNLNDPSRIYKDMYDEDFKKTEAYVYQVPFQLQSYKGAKIRQFRLSYIRGSKIFPMIVWGVPISEGQIWHLPIGWSRDGIYGRSFLASVIDDVEILNQILRNYATIARYRALGKKIFTVGSDMRPGSPADVQTLRNELNDAKDEEHIVINKEFKQADLSFTGQNDPMDVQTEFLRNDIGSGLVPNHMTPWSGTTTYATAGRAQIPFELLLDNLRESVEQFLTQYIIGNHVKHFPKLDKNAEFILGIGVDLDSTEEKMNWASSLYTNNAITLNEYRKAAGYDPVENGDIWGSENSPPMDQISYNYTKRSEEPIIEKENIEGGVELLESVKSDEDFEDFQKKLRARGESTKNWNRLNSSEIGGHKLFLVKTEEDYRIYDGVRLINKFQLDEAEIARLAYKKAIDRVKNELEEFFEGETEEDKIVDELFKKVKKQQYEMMDDFFTTLENNKVKKEAFLSPSVLNGITDVFDKFNSDLRTYANDAVQKLLNINIKQGEIGNPKPQDKALVQLLRQKAALMKKNLFFQLKTYNQQQAQGIRRIVTDGIASGQTVGNIKQKLKDDYVQWKTKPSPGDYKIDRIVRTELNKGSSLLKLRKWAEMGFEKYKWRTRQDEKVRKEHAERNNRIYSIADALSGRDIFPGSEVNCRCFPQLWE